LTEVMPKDDFYGEEGDDWSNIDRMGFSVAPAEMDVVGSWNNPLELGDSSPRLGHSK
jgi:hypothetical protein